jgi:hypothetical protein
MGGWRREDGLPEDGWEGRWLEDGWEDGVGGMDRRKALGACMAGRRWRMNCRMDGRMDGRAVVLVQGWQSLMTVVGDDGGWRGGC